MRRARNDVSLHRTQPLGARLAQSWLLPEDTCAGILWHHDYASIDDGSAVLSPTAISNIAVTLAAQYVYCRNKMGLLDPEWRRGGAFALARLGVEQEALDALGRDLMKELAAG